MYDRFIKFLNKNYKINKNYLKQNDIILTLVKDVDNSALVLKQFSK